MIADLCANLCEKRASDAWTIEHAQAFLAHAAGKKIRRIYRRKPARVKPLR
jgi:hypothetical protein